MSTNNDGWILMSERKPTEADLPILLWNQCVPKAKYCAAADALRCQLNLTCFNAWMKAPAPPREKTREDKDGAAYTNWRISSFQHGPFIAWQAALAYERAEVGKMLPPVRPLVSYGTGIIETERAIEAIRARCGGAK